MIKPTRKSLTVLFAVIGAFAILFVLFAPMLAVWNEKRAVNWVLSGGAGDPPFATEAIITVFERPCVEIALRVKPYYYYIRFSTKWINPAARKLSWEEYKMWHWRTKTGRP